VRLDVAVKLGERVEVDEGVNMAVNVDVGEGASVAVFARVGVFDNARTTNCASKVCAARVASALRFSVGEGTGVRVADGVKVGVTVAVCVAVGVRLGV